MPLHDHFFVASINRLISLFGAVADGIITLIFALFGSLSV